MFLSLFFLLELFILYPVSKAGDEKWDYVNVRKNAYMFWWLYKADDYQDKPLIIWLQGGPGAGGSGYGNFQEIGPLDDSLNPRNTTWLKKASLLFIDNPVGAGFSYVTENSAYVKSSNQMSNDLLSTLTQILEAEPTLQDRPLYIFGESYGGKFTAALTPKLYQAIASGKITCNFKGVVFGDSWISPPDFALEWAPYLYANSFLSDEQLKTANEKAQQVQAMFQAKQYKDATQKYLDLYDLLGTYTNWVDYYDIRRNGLKATKDKMYKTDSQIYRFLTPYGADNLTNFMNTKIRDKLGIIPDNVKWGAQSTSVYAALFEDFMKTAYDEVSEILQQNDLSVTIYNGQFDALVSTSGVLRWVNKLKWQGASSWKKAAKDVVLLSNNQTGGFKQTYDKLTFFWVQRAGHLISNEAEAPEFAYNALLDHVISSQD